MNLKNLLISFVLASSFLSLPSVADIAIIVHPSNQTTLNAHTVARIFLGKQKTYADQVSAIPLDQAINTPIYEDFARAVLRRRAQQVKAYWAQQIFTGKGTPPRSVNNTEELKKLISENPSFIGYIDASEVDDRVHVALIIQRPPNL